MPAQTQQEQTRGLRTARTNAVPAQAPHAKEREKEGTPVIDMRTARRCVLGVLIASAALWIVGIASASADAPWWQLASDARPSNLPSGHAKEEVNELKVSAIAGEFFLIDVEAGAFLPFKWNATASEVQQGLE